MLLNLKQSAELDYIITDRATKEYLIKKFYSNSSFHYKERFGLHFMIEDPTRNELFIVISMQIFCSILSKALYLNI
jgi:hypothetical protein